MPPTLHRYRPVKAGDKWSIEAKGFACLAKVRFETREQAQGIVEWLDFQQLFIGGLYIVGNVRCPRCHEYLPGHASGSADMCQCG